MDLTKNLMTFHSRIDTAVKNMMKDGKIDQYDIPELLLLIADLQTASMTEEDLRIAITELYEYIMTHYKLFPDDEIQKANFKRLFDSSLKLVLMQPKVKKAVKRCFPCLSS